MCNDLPIDQELFIQHRKTKRKVAFIGKILENRNKKETRNLWLCAISDALIM